MTEWFTDVQRVQDLYKVARREKLVDQGLIGSKVIDQISAGTVQDVVDRLIKMGAGVLAVPDVVRQLYAEGTIGHSVAVLIMDITETNWPGYDEWGMLREEKDLVSWLGWPILDVKILLR